MVPIRRCTQGLFLLAASHATAVYASTVETSHQTVETPIVTADSKADKASGLVEPLFRPDEPLSTDETAVFFEKLERKYAYYRADSELQPRPTSTVLLLFAAMWTAFIYIYLWRWNHSGEYFQDTLARHLVLDSKGTRIRPLKKYEPDLAHALVSASLAFFLTALYKVHTDRRPRPYTPTVRNHPIRGVLPIFLGTLVTAYAVITTMLGTEAIKVAGIGVHAVLGFGVGMLSAGFIIFLYSLYSRYRLRKRLAALGMPDGLEGYGADSAPKDANNQESS